MEDLTDTDGSNVLLAFLLRKGNETCDTYVYEIIHGALGKHQFLSFTTPKLIKHCARWNHCASWNMLQTPTLILGLWNNMYDCRSVIPISTA